VGTLILTSPLAISVEKLDKKRYLEDMGFAASNPQILFFEELDEAMDGPRRRSYRQQA
jgi:hypothetical protein